MNLYRIQREAQQRRVDESLNKFAFFAFLDKQFEEGLRKLNIDEADAGEKLTRIVGGGFVLKDHAQEFKDILSASSKKRVDAMADPETGRQFIYDMFYDELANHEYIVSGSVWETLDALGFSWEEVRADPIPSEELDKACKKIMHWDGEE